ncbi:MAG: hypothetical protein ABS42_00200 [Bdellovibrio sp. SCN 50-8]|nr:MAG: hypothetical protein ABS42_00200 [Bdellovibrio sp. SCN 50-8]
MVLTVIAVLSLSVFWYLANQGLVRSWRFEKDLKEERHFEREWEFKTSTNSFYFSVPSFKTAVFEVQPANSFSNLLTNLMGKLRLSSPTLIEKKFRFLTEEPKLAELLSQKPEVLEALGNLQIFAKFRIVSSGDELHGWIQFNEKSKDPVLERADFQRALHTLAPLLDAQFGLPLTEMKPKDLRDWKIASSLPLAMAASAVVVWLANHLIAGTLIFEPSSSKVWLGLSLFMTGICLFWGALRIPPHYFHRTAIAFIFLFSWSSFIWIYGVVTSLNPYVASQTLSIGCVLDQKTDGLLKSSYSCKLINSDAVVYLPADQIKESWLAASKDGVNLKLDVVSGAFGQVFLRQIDELPLERTSITPAVSE